MDKKKDRLIHLIKKAEEQYSDENIVLAVPGFVSKKFIAYCAMKEDLELILQFISELRGNPKSVLKSALAYSLISLYGKCFTDATTRSFPKLEPTELFKKGKERHETHEYLMKLRHEFIAHRGETESEIGIAYILVPKNGALDKTQVRFSQIKRFGFSKEELDRLESLIKYLIDKLIEKIQKIGQKVHDGMFNLFTPEELTLMMMNGAK